MCHYWSLKKRRYKHLLYHIDTILLIHTIASLLDTTRLSHACIPLLTHTLHISADEAHHLFHVTALQPTRKEDLCWMERSDLRRWRRSSPSAVFNLRFWDGGTLGGERSLSPETGGDGGEGEWIFNEGNELETLIIVLVSPTAPQAKIFSYNETVLQWKTPFLSEKSLKISLPDTWYWGGTGLRPEIWRGGDELGGNGPSARNLGGVSPHSPPAYGEYETLPIGGVPSSPLETIIYF